MSVKNTHTADRASMRAASILGLCLPADTLLYLVLVGRVSGDLRVSQSIPLCGQHAARDATGWRDMHSGPEQ